MLSIQYETKRGLHGISSLIQRKDRAPLSSVLHTTWTIEQLN